MSGMLQSSVRLAKRILQPAALDAVQRHLRVYFEAGEMLLASDISAKGNAWSATNRAVYIEPLSRRAKSDSASLLRIPYERIISLSETRQGHDVDRRLRCFPRIGGYHLSETGSDVTPLTEVASRHIEDLVIERRSQVYQGNPVRFVCRKVEPDHHAYWYLEEYADDIDPLLDSFKSWLDGTLDSLNN